MRPSTGPKVRLPRGGNHCDFCGNLFVHKLYSCQNFTFNGSAIFTRRAGRWGACEPCGKIVDAGKWGALTARVLRIVGRRSGITAEELESIGQFISVLHLSLSTHLTTADALLVNQPHYLKITG